VAVVAPEQVERAVELMIDGRDVPLLRPGGAVRLEIARRPDELRRLSVELDLDPVQLGARLRQLGTGVR
jgi:hypothetical protein